jgi:hypothetical protein
MLENVNDTYIQAIQTVVFPILDNCSANIIVVFVIAKEVSTYNFNSI